MNLNGEVRCDCWERGLTAPTPLAARIFVDEDGDLSLHPIGGVGLVHAAEYSALRAWMRSACGHPQMLAAATEVASWRDTFVFKEGLLLCEAAIGERVMANDEADRHDALLSMHRSNLYGPVHAFATLLDEVPDYEMYFPTSADAAGRMYNEIVQFEGCGSFAVKYTLCDATSGEALWTTLGGESVWNAITPEPGRWWTLPMPDAQTLDEAHRRIALQRANRWPGVDAHLFVRSGDVQLGVDAGGLVVIDREGHPLFRSARFTQVLEGDARAVFRDASTGRRFECGTPIRGAAGCPAELLVETAQQSAADYSGITTALRRLCRAAIETGHAIEWTD